MVDAEAGIEMEAALPVGASQLTAAGATAGGRAETVASAGASSGAEMPALDEPSGMFQPSKSSLGSMLERSAEAMGLGTKRSDRESIEERFQRLLETVHAYRPGDDLEIIRKAWVFCVRQHEGQKRASGEPYIIHPLEVGQVLAELKMDSTAIAAGLLHDAVEDTNITTDEIEKQFGDQVAHIVEGVTKLDKIKFANREDHQAENIRKMLLAMVTDVRVVIIKLADRLHNMRTLEHLRSRRSSRRSRARRWRSTRRWRIGWAWASCAASLKTWPSATPIPLHVREGLTDEVNALARGGRKSSSKRIVKKLEAKLLEHHT